mmetsp:Transcript_52382/g.157195  ORF Transcript_52382/g.157195 Transcript_52382/m.157195 type:complete len:111 (+) Transcript_52382:1682-2014(+)
MPRATHEVIECLIAASPEALRVRNHSGQAAFDVAVRFFEHGRSIGALSAFIGASPRILEDKDPEGKTQFHVAVATGKGDPSQLRALSMMLDASPEIAAIPGSVGMWPALF